MAALAEMVRFRMLKSDLGDYEAGREAISKLLAERFECSPEEAVKLVDQLEAGGYVSYADESWHVDVAPTPRQFATDGSRPRRAHQT